MTKYQTMYDEAIKINETRKAELYANQVKRIQRRVHELENQLAYMREDTPEDLKEREKIIAKQDYERKIKYENGICI